MKQAENILFWLGHILLAASISLSATGSASAQSGEAVDIDIDFAQILRLSAPAGTIVIGNPEIADAAVRDEHMLVLTGKTAGITNLVVLNEAGQEISNLLLRVGRQGGKHVTVRHGLQAQTFVCTPTCGSEIPKSGETVVK